MTALKIIRALTSDRSRVLWINHERCEAALSPGSDTVCVPLDYSEACVARTDTNLGVVEECDGEIIQTV